MHVWTSFCRAECERERREANFEMVASPKCCVLRCKRLHTTSPRGALTEEILPRPPPHGAPHGTALIYRDSLTETFFSPLAATHVIAIAIAPFLASDSIRLYIRLLTSGIRNKPSSVTWIFVTPLIKRGSMITSHTIITEQTNSDSFKLHLLLNMAISN